MFLTIVGAILFVSVGIPVIFYCIALLLGCVGDVFANIIGLPKRIANSYRKEGLKGLLSKFTWLAIVFDFYCFILGGMCIGIAIFAKTKVAPLTYVPTYKVEPLSSAITFAFGCFLVVLSILFTIKINSARQKKNKVKLS